MINDQAQKVQFWFVAGTGAFAIVIYFLGFMSGYFFIGGSNPKYSCMRGVTFVETQHGLSWVPDLSGKPVSCLDFGGDLKTSDGSGGR